MSAMREGTAPSPTYEITAKVLLAEVVRLEDRVGELEDALREITRYSRPTEAALRHGRAVLSHDPGQERT